MLMIVSKEQKQAKQQDKTNKFQSDFYNFYCSKMDKKISFVQELTNQLNQYQIEKIILNQQKHQKIHPRLNQNKAKQTLIDLGDLNQSTQIEDNAQSICRWNNKKDLQNPQQSQPVTKRNNLLTERYRGSENRLETLRSFSTKQIPQLKLLLEKLSTPTNKKKKRPEQRGVLTSAPRNKKHYDLEDQVLVPRHYNQAKQQILQPKGFITDRKISSHRPKTLEKKDCQNKNPILYPINQTIKEKSRLKEYQKINRKGSNHWNLLKNSNNQNNNDLLNEKQLLQNLIKNTISNQGMGSKVTSQAALNFLGQYSNLNYFSSNFKNEQKKKGTLTNLLI